MEKYQEYFGKKFYQDKKTGYWISTSCPKIRAHCWVWINHNGKIPKGFHIHHFDENKSNNDISNLRLLHASEHLRLHMTEERRKEASIWAEKIRPLTKEWHASEEGRTWHKYHAIKCKFGRNESKKYNCDVCQKDFFSTKLSNTKFCSNNCKSQWRRKSGIDDVSRVCQKCKKTFSVNKYAKNKYCGKSCGKTKDQPCTT